MRAFLSIQSTMQQHKVLVCLDNITCMSGQYQNIVTDSYMFTFNRHYAQATSQTQCLQCAMLLKFFSAPAQHICQLYCPKAIYILVYTRCKKNVKGAKNQLLAQRYFQPRVPHFSQGSKLMQNPQKSCTFTQTAAQQVIENLCMKEAFYGFQAILELLHKHHKLGIFEEHGFFFKFS
eukprot:TRINITY_DN13060_c0_g1_i1.p1 TRINITY_DN13060_c0_g1~~TRINITY_DN13060_c0_g1_i1.p1  ORF type:complete len:193 (-),score=-9.23 TRINITY_DN13060_c0_g1_i1:408-938(-)